MAPRCRRLACHAPALRPRAPAVLARASAGSGGRGKERQYKGLTPYQGPERVFGTFICVHCHRKWYSASSWANCAQECQRCRKRVFPCEQARLEKADAEAAHTIDLGKPHPQELCDKCKQLGYDCRTQMIRHR